MNYLEVCVLVTPRYAFISRDERTCHVPYAAALSPQAYFISRDELLVLAKRYPATLSTIRRTAFLWALRRMVVALAKEARTASPSARAPAALDPTTAGLRHRAASRPTPSARMLSALDPRPLSYGTALPTRTRASLLLIALSCPLPAI